MNAENWIALFGAAVTGGALVWAVLSWRADRRRQRQLDAIDEYVQAYSTALLLVQKRSNDDKARAGALTAMLKLALKTSVTREVLREYGTLFRRVLDDKDLNLPSLLNSMTKSVGGKNRELSAQDIRVILLADDQDDEGA